MDKNFWKDKKVFVTGHTGFKGSWLTQTLIHLGAKVTGYSNMVPTTPGMFNLNKLSEKMEKDIRGDVRDLENLTLEVKLASPDIIFHLAAQPVVRTSYADPVGTYSTNVMGTVNLLMAAQGITNLKSIVCITTDKCYENKEWDRAYHEDDELGGYDPYSSSKACAELLVASFRNSFFKELGINVATVRAGNVIGGGDWTADRIIPDLVRAFEKNTQLNIRAPKSTRPWQHVMEPVKGYMILAQRLYSDTKFAEAWNFGPEENDCWSVEKVCNTLLSHWPQHKGWTLTESTQALHEAKLLKLNCDKAKARLQWKPSKSLSQALELTSLWYQAYFNGEDMTKVTSNQINEFLG